MTQLTAIPTLQRAVQLIGPNKLVFSEDKKVHLPGPNQILCKVEAVGLCFSDLKLLKQFSDHPRKKKILSGIDLNVLCEIPSYAPDAKPTVPGHEACVKVVHVGRGVTKFKGGQRYLVETDYRWLTSENSNGSFGYNFEGALQEYVLMDERVITSPEGQSMLISVPEDLSASAIAMIEPWACVEHCYAMKERQKLKTNGKTLIVCDIEINGEKLNHFFERYDTPSDCKWIGKCPSCVRIKSEIVNDIESLPDAAFDDVIYFGADSSTVERLFGKLAIGGLFNIVQCGEKFGGNISAAVGRLHYSRIRIIGTQGCDPAESMKIIPRTPDIRSGDKINIVGAGGPMGMMHIIRNICQRFDRISIFAGDIDDKRLENLRKIAEPLAKNKNVEVIFYNPNVYKPNVTFDYTILSASVPSLVSDAIESSSDGAIINVFAGITPSANIEIDLNKYISKKLYAVGSSGSTADDMKTVLFKVQSGLLDTNVSLAAVCGLEFAADAIYMVENRSIPGKIVVYPACRGLALLRLQDLEVKHPEIAGCLCGGLWTKSAEDKLLRTYTKSSSI